MNRTRTLLVAGGISVALVATSVGFAYANGAFGSPAVDRVGSFQAIQAGLVPTTSTPTSRPAQTAPLSRASSTSTSTISRPSSRPPSDPPVTASTDVPRRGTVPEPTVPPTSQSVGTPDRDPVGEPTTVHAGRPTATHAPQASTTSRPRRDGETDDPPEDPSRDD